VPAAAVIRERQALLVFNGSIGWVGGIVNLLAITHNCGVYITILEYKEVINTARRG